MSSKLRWLAPLAAAAVVAAYVAWPRERAPTAPASAASAAAKRAPAARVDPKAQPTAALAGVVRDIESAEPIANATVCVVYAGDDRRCVQSGADGHYAIANVVRDHAALVVSAVRYQAAKVDVPALDPGEQLALDVALEGGAVELTGVVEDILGGPIANAYVIAEHARVETDDQGRFSVWMRPRGSYRTIESRAPGYGQRSHPVTVPGHVVIALAPDSAITGKIVDATTGAPLPGARVIAYPWGAEATSGAEGTFTIDGLAAGDYQLEASTGGRFGRLPRVVPVGIGQRVEDILLEVYPARTVVATIDLVGDSKICAPSPALNDRHLGIAPPWRDEAGRFHFDGVPPGIYTVSLGCGAQVPPLVVGDGDLEVTWRVASGGVVRGNVRAPAKRSERDDVVIQLARAGSRRPPIVDKAVGRKYAVRGIPAGTYTLTVTSGANEGKPHTFEIKNGETIEHDIVIEERARGRIAGVVSERGTAARATVHVTGVNIVGSFEVQTRDGRYELEVPAGVYRVYANSQTARGDARDIIDVDAGKVATLDIELAHAFDPDLVKAATAHDERYTLTGRVVDARGQAVDGAIVTAVEKHFWQPHEEPSLRATTRGDGAFTLVSRNARINVDVVRIGDVRATATLDAGKPATITLAPKPQITGTVVLANGTPAPRFQIRTGDGGGRTDHFAYTGGRFSIADPGEYPLRIAALVNGLAGEPVTLTAADAKTAIVLRLPTTVTITGRMLDASTREPIANVRITGRQSLDGWAPWFTHADQVSAADGTFTLRDLPPGPLMLEIVPPVDTWSAHTVNITVPDKPGDIGEIGLAQTRKR